MAAIFPPQTADVDIHYAVIPVIVMAPHLLDELVAAERTTVVAHKNAQQVKLHWRQVERSAFFPG